MDARQFITQQLGTAGWAPIHPGMAMFLCPEADNVNTQRDLAIDQKHPEQLCRIFNAALYLAKVEGFGVVPILSRSPQFLAERMGWLGLTVSEVTEYADAPAGRTQITSKPKTTTSDRLALLHSDVATKEAGRPCKHCGNLSSEQTCLVPSELEGAPGGYRPDLTWPRKCLSYKAPRIIEDNPQPSDYDRRTGRDLWPEVVAVVGMQVDSQSAIGKAVALLANLLKDGPKDAAEILAAAEGAGISERSLQRGAEQMGVIKTKAGFDGGWTWAIPIKEAA